LVLFERIGPGEHPCEWCGLMLRWTKTQKESPRALLADHLDGDPTNDSSGNIVPSCNTCNCKRGMTIAIQPGEKCVKVGNGWRRAAEIQCPHCKKLFLSPVTSKMVPLRTYCSSGCFNKHGNKNGAIAMHEARRIPDGVEKTFDGVHFRRSIKYKCSHCEKEYYNRPKKGGRIYCSRGCRVAALRVAAGFPADVEISVLNGVRRGVERRKCEQCGSEFLFPIMMQGVNAGKYCSKSCGSRSRGKKAAV
jgi:hypothetical protein